MSINGRIKTLEKYIEDEEPQEPELINPYPHWLSYSLDAFKTNQVRPGCMAMQDGVCVEWVVNGPYIHGLIKNLNKHLGFETPQRFDNVEDCQQTIDWLHKVALEIKEVIDDQLTKSDLN